MAADQEVITLDSDDEDAANSSTAGPDLVKLQSVSRVEPE
jgi:hypothetical protein